MKKIAHIGSLLVLLLCLFPDASLLAKQTARYDSVLQPNALVKAWVVTKPIDASRFSKDSVSYYKEQAIFSSKNRQIAETVYFTDLYIKYSGDTQFVDSDYFEPYRDQPAFQELMGKYGLDFGWINFFYLFCAFIGFYISLMMWMRDKNDKMATLLISVFVVIHSLFIFHIFLFNTNLQFRTPHILYMSALTAYLYGPLIYLYFKRITLNYKFRKRDLLHFIPTLIIFIALLPVLLLPSSEKLRIMLDVGWLDRTPYLDYVVLAKFLSLGIYGFLTLRVYIREKERINIMRRGAQRWIRNLVILTEAYVLSYIIYGLTLLKLIPNPEFLFDLQILFMATMVLYVGYTANRRPNLLSREFLKRRSKYVKSGLTPAFSFELKTQLLALLEEDKIYRDNHISLAQVSDMLGTTRHNTSQVINEHFGLNFFELINRYRIREAVSILSKDKDRNRNIIDVAYEVGFNNKVTFNKSFRKEFEQTPTQYLSSMRLS